MLDFYSLITSYSNFNWGAYNQPNLTLSLRRFLAVVQQVSLLYDCFWIDSIDPMFFCIFLGGAKGKYIYAYIFGIFISIAENVGDDFKETISNQKPNTMMMLNSDKSCLCTLLKDGINMNEV